MKIDIKRFLLFLAGIGLMATFTAQSQAQSAVPGSEIIGKWDLTVTIEDEAMENLGLFRHGLYADDDGFPAWLEVKLSGFSTLVGRFVGYEGSARPISEVKYDAENGVYSFSIPPQWMDIDEDLYFEMTIENDVINGYFILDGNQLDFTGVRAPSLTREEPPVWGNPKNLLDDNLSSWIIPNNNQFRMVDGILVNQAVGGNMVSKEEFEDFKLSVEFKLPEGSNSGIYLRGRYELQIEDIESTTSEISIGGIYGFIAPAVDVPRSADQWQSFEVTLVGRHITVVHNGIEVISNRPIPGITGGSLNSNEGEPGPIMIQGDHGPIEFRKFTITPALN
jgi:hypothetical protein